jgi:hypothetical protein
MCIELFMSLSALTGVDISQSYKLREKAMRVKTVKISRGQDRRQHTMSRQTRSLVGP